jgi:hypothetical protein
MRPPFVIAIISPNSTAFVLRWESGEPELLIRHGEDLLPPATLVILDQNNDLVRMTLTMEIRH